jgi:signal transduction histidine kinase
MQAKQVSTPANNHADETSHEVVITAFRLLNQDLPVDSLLQLKRVELAHNQNSFRLSFASPGFSQKKKLTYYYKLDGAEKEWITTDKPLSINYTLLPPGSYTFMVKSQDEKGTFSQKITRLSLLIKIPFWLSWWFIILCCATFAAAVYYFHRQSLNRILAVEAIRQKVARDLHDDIGSTLSTINILSMMAKGKLAEDPEKASEYLGKISDNSNRLMESIDDIVWSINPGNDSMQKIIARMLEVATEVLEPKDIQLQFYFDDASKGIRLDMEERRDFFLIFKEAINNIAKYAHATEVNIQLTFTANILKLSIQDNGVGFDVEKADEGNGLSNMQKRAEKLHGKLHIQSQLRRGTTVSVEIQTT